jgi:nucleotide-binding universal stress UspA family protein
MARGDCQQCVWTEGGVIMKGSIIVPLDGSRFGEYALPYAFSIARRANLPVHLVHVHQNLTPVYAPAFAIAGDSPDQEIRRDERDYLQRTRERTRLEQDVEMPVALIDGDVADALDQYAHDVNASLIVMSCDDRGSLQRFLLGSITDQLMRTSIPPLLLVHPRNENLGFDVDFHLNHLLLPLESAVESEEMLKRALELSALFDGECTLFHVVEHAVTGGHAPHSASPERQNGPPDSCCDAHAHFERLAQVLRQQGHKAAVKIVEGSCPATAVLEEADSGNIDWIAVSSLKRPRLSQLMFGNTADKIIHDAKVPVFVFLPGQI